jgi:hypothetical protein
MQKPSRLCYFLFSSRICHRPFLSSAENIYFFTFPFSTFSGQDHKLDLIKGLGSRSQTRRCVLIFSRISQTRFAVCPCGAGCTMTLKERRQPRKIFLP